MIYIALILTLFLGIFVGWVSCLVHIAAEEELKKSEVVEKIKKKIKLTQNSRRTPQAAIFIDEEKTEEEEAIEQEEKILKTIKPMP